MYLVDPYTGRVRHSLDGFRRAGSVAVAWVGCIESCEGAVDVPGHGDVYVSVGVVPVQGKSEVEVAIFVRCCFVLFVDCIL